jgi:hypothetical protein
MERSENSNEKQTISDQATRTFDPIQAIIDEWYKTLNYESVQKSAAVTLPKAEVLQVIGYLQASIGKMKHDGETLLTVIQQRDNLRAQIICDVCLGKPLASDKRCMCGGTGYKTNGVDYLREQLHRAESMIDHLDSALSWCEAVGDDFGKYRKDIREYEKTATTKN